MGRQPGRSAWRTRWGDAYWRSLVRSLWSQAPTAHEATSSAAHPHLRVTDRTSGQSLRRASNAAGKMPTGFAWDEGWLLGRPPLVAVLSWRLSLLRTTTGLLVAGGPLGVLLGDQALQP